MKYKFLALSYFKYSVNIEYNKIKWMLGCQIEGEFDNREDALEMIEQMMKEKSNGTLYFDVIQVRIKS